MTLKDLREKKARIAWHLDHCASEMERHRETADAYARQIDLLRKEAEATAREIAERMPETLSFRPVRMAIREDAA